MARDESNDDKPVTRRELNLTLRAWAAYIVVGTTITTHVDVSEVAGAATAALAVAIPLGVKVVAVLVRA